MVNWGLMIDFDVEDWKELWFRFCENYVDSIGKILIIILN